MEGTGRGGVGAGDKGRVVGDLVAREGVTAGGERDANDGG